MVEAKQSARGQDRSRLTIHIVVILLVKLVLLTGLWFAFIKPHRVRVDPAAMGDHLAGPAAATPAAPEFSPPSPLIQEKTHDRLDGR